MKKQLLLGSALLAAISAFPQNGRLKPAGVANAADLIATKYAVLDENAPAKLNLVPQKESAIATEDAKVATINTSISWKLLCGSANTYGMLVSQSQPLQYNDNVNAVSFIHRKSATYNATPAGNSNSGTIVAEISSNWGTSFDSTCVWADANNGGRYPQGGIYSAPGNTQIQNAYVIATGPIVTSGSSFTGDFYASKQLGTPGSAAYNTTADAAPNAQQYVPFGQASYPPNLSAHGWSRYGFTSTDDGIVRSLALISDDNTTLGSAAMPRGVGIVKGVFNAGVFTWTMDSIIPNAIIASAGDKQISSNPQMAWNEAGTVGYVVVPGALASATLNNMGIQPIIYKTTNSGTSWAPINPIDFNSAPMQPILDHIASLNTNTNITIPYLDDYDLVVDANNNLHIGAVFNTAASNHPDSLYYYSQYTVSINPTDKYKWAHEPGNRPYLYDFVGDGTSAWVYQTIDSISSEDPGAGTTAAGYNDNPWDPTGTGSAKLNIDSRLQLSRTPDGKFVTYSWVESDSNFTPGGKKYNVIPNIKVRCSGIGAGTSMTVSTTEINVTKIAAGQGTNNAQVNSRATLHYMSPTSSAATVQLGATTSTADVIVPFTVTNSNPFSQLTNNTTWYGSAKLSFAFSSLVTVAAQNAANSVSNSFVYPNPAKNAAVLAIDLKNNTSVSINVYNTIGQLVKTITAAGQVGANNINIDLASLTTGVYIVNVNAGNATSTKKLIVE